MEVEWTGESPSDAIAALRERFGRAASVAVAIDLDALFLKRVELPPLPAAERRQILRLEPERFFPVRGEQMVVALRDGDDLVFAIPADVLETWMAAIETLGPVDLVEPAPAALARALARNGIQSGAVIVQDIDGQGTGVVDVAGGHLVDARRVAGGISSAAAALGPTPREHVFLTVWSPEVEADASIWFPGIALRPVPVAPGLAPGFAVAWGAVVGLRSGSELRLESDQLARRITRRRRLRFGVALAAAVGAVVLTALAFDARRSRLLTELESVVAQHQAEASTVLDLIAEANALDREATTLSELMAGRSNPLEVLLAATRALPEDAYLRTVEGTGSDWELTGYARDAASLIPVLEESAGFTDVRFRSATSRVQVDNQDYEAFSILVRWADTP